jgi:hypothetical protein
MSVACQLPSRPVPGRARRTAALAGLTAVLAAGAVAAAGPAAAEAAFGSAPVTAAPAAPQTPVTIRSIAVGRHAAFDRVAFRLSGPTAGYDVRYVPRLIQDPTGAVLPLAGSAVLTVVLRQTTWVDAPSPRLNQTVGFPALKQVRSAGEFEATASYGLGQAGRDGFRVFRLTGPDRIVVDLRHPAGAAQAGAPAGSAGAAGTGGSAGSAESAGTGGVAGAGTGAGTGSGIGDGSADAESSGGLAATGDSSVVPLALVGGLLLLAGLVAAGVGLRIAHR